MLKKGNMKYTMKKTMMTIRAEQDERGWYLIDSGGNYPQEGMRYDDKASALHDCEELWPSDSTWEGNWLDDDTYKIIID